MKALLLSILFMFSQSAFACPDVTHALTSQSDSVAQSANQLQEGDVIVEVMNSKEEGWVSAKTLSAEDTMRLMRGTSNNTVAVKVMRDGETVEIALARNKVQNSHSRKTIKKTQPLSAQKAVKEVR